MEGSVLGVVFFFLNVVVPGVAVAEATVFRLRLAIGVNMVGPFFSVLPCVVASYGGKVKYVIIPLSTAMLFVVYSVFDNIFVDVVRVDIGQAAAVTTFFIFTAGLFSLLAFRPVAVLPSLITMVVAGSTEFEAAAGGGVEGSFNCVVASDSGRF